jgi:hypothetical protein
MWIVPDRRVCAAAQVLMGFATPALALHCLAPEIGPSRSAIARCAPKTLTPTEVA